MTKSKSKPKPKPAEKFILASGSHSRQEGGKRRKYEAGDLLSISAAELEQFPAKFMTLDEYAAMLEGDKRQRAADRAMQAKMLAPRVRALGQRDSAAITRGRKLRNLRHKGERRVLMS